MSIRQMNTRFNFGLGILGFLIGAYEIVLSPGIGSTLSWVGISLIVGSSLYLLITMRVLQALYHKGRDKQTRWRVGFILLLIYTLLGLGLMALGLSEKTPEMSKFYLFAGLALISASTIWLKFGWLKAWTQ